MLLSTNHICHAGIKQQTYPQNCSGHACLVYHEDKKLKAANKECTECKANAKKNFRSSPEHYKATLAQRKHIVADRVTQSIFSHSCIIQAYGLAYEQSKLSIRLLTFPFLILLFIQKVLCFSVYNISSLQQWLLPQVHTFETITLVHGYVI